MNIFDMYVHETAKTEGKHSIFESYINEGAAWKVKLYHEDEKEDNYKNKVKKDKSKIEAAVNRVSKDIFKTFGENSHKKYDSKSGDYYAKLLAELDKFMKGKAPTVDYFDQQTDYIEIQMKYPKGTTNDMCLFYQDELVKALNKDDSLKSLGYKFSSEDYLAIYIIV